MIAKLFLLLTLLTTGCHGGPVSTPASHARVLIVGDSLIYQADPSLRFIAALDAKVDLTTWAIGGSALCDQIPRLQSDGTPFDVLVVAFSGNALTPCMSHRKANAVEAGIGYADDLAVVARLAKSRGQKVIVVGDPDEHPVGKVIPVVRAHTFASADRYGLMKLDLSVKLASMPRAPDGLHLCPPGPTEQKCSSAGTYAAAMLDGVYRLMGLR